MHQKLEILSKFALKTNSFYNLPDVRNAKLSVFLMFKYYEIVSLKRTKTAISRARFSRIRSKSSEIQILNIHTELIVWCWT